MLYRSAPHGELEPRAAATKAQMTMANTVLRTTKMLVFWPMGRVLGHCGARWERERQREWEREDLSRTYKKKKKKERKEEKSQGE